MAWTEKTTDVNLHFSPSFVYMLMFYSFITIKRIELCSTVDVSVHIAETACRLCSYLRLQSKILENLQPLFCCRFCWEKKVQACIFVFQQKQLQAWTVDSQLYFICFCLLESKAQRSGRGVGAFSSIVCVLRLLFVYCRVHSALSCLVPVLKLSWNLITL